jgi:hypothetical protein
VVDENAAMSRNGGVKAQALDPRIDLVLSAGIYLAALLIGRRLSAYPFDDEVYTLVVARNADPGATLKWLLWGGDTKAVLAYASYIAAARMGFTDQMLRWLSVACTCAALALWHLIALGSTDTRSVPRRLGIALLMGLTPLALGRGAALRWYPLFALLVAVAFWIYLRPGRWHLSGIALGLALQTNVLALLCVVALATHRYLFDGCRVVREFLIFFGLAALFSLPGVVGNFQFAAFRHELLPGIVTALASDVIGFFGGCTLGLGQLSLILPALGGAIVLAAIAWRASAHSPARRTLALVALVAISIVPLLLSGLRKPHALFFLAPMLSAVEAIGLAKAKTHDIIAWVSWAAIIVSGAAVTSNLPSTFHPFKRQASIPFGDILKFCSAVPLDQARVLSSDPTVAYELSRSSRTCVISPSVIDDEMQQQGNCSAEPKLVIVLHGYRELPNRPRVAWERAVASAVEGRKIVVQRSFGIDLDAPLKSRLTGVALPTELIHASIYE